MRVTNYGLTNRVKQSLSTQAGEVGRLYGQLTSGKRLQALSDDPSAMVRSLRAHASLNELDARQTVAGQAQQLLNQTDTVLGEVANSLSQAKALALQATTSTVGDSARVALAQQLRSLQASLVSAGNSCIQGHYVFGGSQTQTPPLETSDTANLPVLYHGNHQQLTYQVGSEDPIAVGFTGAQVFNYPAADGTRPVGAVEADVFSVLTDLADAIESGDAAQVEQLGAQVEDLHAYAVNLRGQAGVLSKRWQAVDDKAGETAVLLNQVISTEESVDYTSAIVELSNLETAYEAALSLTSRMLQLPSLFEQS